MQNVSKKRVNIKVDNNFSLWLYYSNHLLSKNVQNSFRILFPTPTLPCWSIVSLFDVHILISHLLGGWMGLHHWWLKSQCPSGRAAKVLSLACSEQKSRTCPPRPDPPGSCPGRRPHLAKEEILYNYNVTQVRRGGICRQFLNLN